MAHAGLGPTFSGKSVALLICVSVLLQTLAAEPFGQWYLAWIAVAPWLVVVGSAPTIRSAMRRAFFAGILYFAANLWWLWTASLTGTVVLILYFAAIQSVAAALIRALQLLPFENATISTRGGRSKTVVNIFLIATVWVAVEWFRCTIAVGFPWVPLGSTQTPIPLMCQVADLAGPWIVSLWVMLPNALIATLWLERSKSGVTSWFPVVAVAGALAVVAIYGEWRIATTSTAPGPRVMLVQSDVRYLNGGVPAVDHQTSAPHLLDLLGKTLTVERGDLVVLPEGAFPPLNDEARRELARSPIGASVERAYQELLHLSTEHGAAILVGANAVTDWHTENGAHFGSEIRNSAYYFDPRASEPVGRYDKIQLVRFAERPALSGGPEWLTTLAGYVSAARVAQPLVAGTFDDFRPFRLQWGDASTPAIADFVAPICLENIDPLAVRRMVCGSPSGGKRAQFIANISNDGWFNIQEKHQHLQTVVFRCIENRVPMIRCSNTGESAFIDSCGRVQKTLGTNVERSSVGQLNLDNRQTFYMQHGDVFAIACVFIVGAVWATSAARSICEWRARNHVAPAKKR